MQAAVFCVATADPKCIPNSAVAGGLAGGIERGADMFALGGNPAANRASFGLGFSSGFAQGTISGASYVGVGRVLRTMVAVGLQRLVSVVVAFGGGAIPFLILYAPPSIGGECGPDGYACVA